MSSNLVPYVILVPALVVLGGACVIADEGGDVVPDAAARDGGSVSAPDRGVPDAEAPPAVVLSYDPVESYAVPVGPFDETGRAAFAFDVPADARAVTLSAEGPEGCVMVFEQIVDGAGDVWVSPDPPDRIIDDADRQALPFPGPYLSANRVSWGDAVATALVPSRPDIRPAGGPWQAVLALDPPPAVDVETTVQVQIERGPPVDRGRVDLHFHFTTASDWRALHVRMDPEFRRMLNVATVLLRDAGIELGEVTYTDVDVVSRTITVVPDLARMLSLSRYETGVSVFVVGRIQDETGSPLAGIAGAVPASIGVPGSGANGIAIAHDFAEGQALGLTLAHEIGHALGLFHTVEANPRYGDQLVDTPEGLEGRFNVMYPTGGDEGRRFSPMQGTIMRAGRGVEPPMPSPPSP